MCPLDTDITILIIAKRTIEAHLFNPLSNRCLALQFHINKAKLARDFKLYFGMPMQHYHLVISMEYAMALRLDGRSVKELALLLGYSRPENFTHAFTRIFGKPPSTYKPE